MTRAEYWSNEVLRHEDDWLEEPERDEEAEREAREEAEYEHWQMMADIEEDNRMRQEPNVGGWW